MLTTHSIPVSEPEASVSQNQTDTSSIPHKDPKRLAIKSKNVMLNKFQDPVEAFILIQDGKIADVVLPSETDPSVLANIHNDWNVKDYGDLFIFPGLVDSNVHLHADFGAEWGNVIYSTELAAAGGVTTVIDNPEMCRPYSSGESYVKSLQNRIELIKSESKVDFGVYGILDPQTEKHVDDIMKVGVMGLKCHMMNPFQRHIGYYQSENFKELVERLEENHPDLLLLLHPEVATDRELYASSPCRSIPLEERLDTGYRIKSLEFGGGAHKGSYVEGFTKKSGNEDEEEEENDNSPVQTLTNLISEIKRETETMEIQALAYSELISYKNINNPDEQNNEEQISAPELDLFPSNTESMISRQKDLNEEENSESKPKLHNIKKPILIVTPFTAKTQPIEEQKEEETRKMGSIEEGVLTEIPEELDREESKDTYNLTRSSLNERYKKIQSHEDSQGKSSNEIPTGEHEKTHIDDDHIIHSTRESETRIEIPEEPLIKPRRAGRKRYEAWDGEESEVSKKELNDTVGPIEQNGNRGFSEEIFKQEDMFASKRISTNRRFFSLHLEPASGESKNTEITQEIQVPSIQKPKELSLDSNLIEQSDESPQTTKARSLNISPVSNKGASNLLQRRILSRKSSCGNQGSTTSSLSSPTNDFRKVNALNISNISKGSNTNETQQNQSYRVFLANRPLSWEENAVSTALAAIRPDTKIRLMFQNLSLASSLIKIWQKKNSSQDMNRRVFGETCPSYLYFNETMVKNGETKYKVSPPFRSERNSKILAKIMSLKGIDIISSYHFYVPPRFKRVDDGNFRRAFGGLDCMGCNLQATWTALYNLQQSSETNLTLNQMLRMVYETMCFNPAQLLKISQRKGDIAKGMDADLVIWDPYTQDNNDHLNPNHVFAGKPLMGIVHKTYLRGNLIFSREHCEDLTIEYVPEFLRP